MAAETKIEWATHTFNPWTGCVKVSLECDNCYAEADDIRWHEGKHWGKGSPRLFRVESYWRKPALWNQALAEMNLKRTEPLRERVFCGSMMDIAERREDLDAPRARLFHLIEATPNLDWLLLTKRPQELPFILPARWLKEPRKNVWLLTTVGHPDYLWRIEKLLQVPAVLHGLSAEPLLGPLDISKYLASHGDGSNNLAWGDLNNPLLNRLGWVIGGGESGRKARPTHPGWARDLRDQCVSALVPFLWKQWGEFSPVKPANGRNVPWGVVTQSGEYFPETTRWMKEPGVYSDDSAYVYRVKKTAAGRLIDGVLWDQFPSPTKL